MVCRFYRAEFGILTGIKLSSSIGGIATALIESLQGHIHRTFQVQQPDWASSPFGETYEAVALIVVAKRGIDYNAALTDDFCSSLEDCLVDPFRHFL